MEFSRRDFLKVSGAAGAAVAVAGLTGCGSSEEKKTVLLAVLIRRQNTQSVLHTNQLLVKSFNLLQKNMVLIKKRE